LATKDESGKVACRVAHRPVGDLPAGDVLIRVAYSSLNYKDALSASGHPGVTRKYPHVPGIDAAGVVVVSGDSAVSPGARVIVTGFDLGQNTWGGYSELVRVPAAWVVPLPDGLSLRESMILGTAGFTAGLAADALLARGVRCDGGPVVVTGASGGVGSLSVAILARLGYHVTAVSGKPEAESFLRMLGAASVVGRDTVADATGKPLLPAKWAAAVDTVGGETLSVLVRSLLRGGCVAACGLVGGTDLRLSVYPFLLRGADLVGIDSAEPPRERRSRVWRHLAAEWKPQHLADMATEVGLDELQEPIKRILAGQVTGRIVVRVAGE
jgi:alcohol dehydrogenase